jgi:hypothetical protein
MRKGLHLKISAKIFGAIIKSPTFVLNITIMDWLFRPIGRFFEWSFGGITALNWKFDLFIIGVFTLLTLYWFKEIWVNRKNDKGLFKK